jgi:hypothetical protein
VSPILSLAVRRYVRERVREDVRAALTIGRGQRRPGVRDEKLAA